MIQQYNFDGLGRQIDAQGVFFRYESATDGSGVTDLLVTIDGQNMGVFSPGDSLELPKSARRWEVKPVSSGCLGTVKIGNALIKSQKLSGIVQTVDGGRARSVAGISFAAYAHQAGVASKFAQVQIFNNTGSGRVAVVSGATVVSSIGTGVQMTFAEASIGALYIEGVSKKAGGGFSAAVDARTLSANSSPIGALKYWMVSTGVGSDYKPTEPLIIYPGFGLTFCATNPGADLGVSAEWFEEAA